MIVFIDIIKKECKIYHEKGISVVLLSNLKEIERIIGNNKVLYVKDRVWADKNQILKLLNKNPVDSKKVEKIKDGTLWVHWTGKGTLHISDFGIKQRDGRSGKEREYIGYDFKGPGDFHELNHLKSLGCEKSSQFNNLIKSTGKNKLEIVSGDFKTNFLKSYKSETEKMKDNRLNSIIVDGKASEIARKYKAGEISKSNAIEIDINSSKLSKSDDNEGVLLPRDF
jgi:hypothetical protein